MNLKSVIFDGRIYGKIDEDFLEDSSSSSQIKDKKGHQTF